MTGCMLVSQERVSAEEKVVPMPPSEREIVFFSISHSGRGAAHFLRRTLSSRLSRAVFQRDAHARSACQTRRDKRGRVKWLPWEEGGDGSSVL